MSIISGKSTIQRLKSKKAIDLLFHEGVSLFVFPIKLIFRLEESNSSENSAGTHCGFSVPKRLHGKATTRNLLKRRLREACRLYLTDEITSRNLLNGRRLDIMFILIDKEVTEFPILKRSMIRLRKKLIANINS